MYISTKYLHVFLDIGDALLSSGAEIFRVEDTLNRMGYACGATQMNVFVITSSIVITMEFPKENVRTQTRRIRKNGGNDFEKLEKLNHLSRQFCQNPMSPEELRKVFDQIDKVVPTQTGKLAGSILAAFSFALFYGGNLWDALLAGLAGILIWGAQRHIRKYCMNEVTFQFVASFLTGCFICVMARIFPALHVDKIMGWLLFIICRECWGGVFFPKLAAAFGIDLYAEILARSCRSTSTSFFVTSVIPLIPGSTLYYCMRSVVEGNLHQAWNYGRDTFLYALGIAAGMSIAWAICDFLRKIRGKQEIS